MSEPYTIATREGNAALGRKALEERQAKLAALLQEALAAMIAEFRIDTGDQALAALMRDKKAVDAELAALPSGEAVIVDPKKVPPASIPFQTKLSAAARFETVLLSDIEQGRVARRMAASAGVPPEQVASWLDVPGRPRCVGRAVLTAAGKREAAGQLSPDERRMAASMGMDEATVRKYLPRARAALHGGQR